MYLLSWIEVEPTLSTLSITNKTCILHTTSRRYR